MLPKNALKELQRTYSQIVINDDEVTGSWEITPAFKLNIFANKKVKDWNVEVAGVEGSVLINHIGDSIPQNIKDDISNLATEWRGIIDKKDHVVTEEQDDSEYYSNPENEQSIEENKDPTPAPNYTNGGYNKLKEEVQEAAFEELEPPKEILLHKPKRFIQNFPFSLCRVGNIKIGGKGEVRESRGGKKWQPPTRLSYFNITTMEKGTLEEDGTTEYKTDEVIMTKLGKEPKEIKIRLLFDEIENNLQTSFAKYDSSSRWECRGDGETAEQRKTGKIVRCDGFECPQYKKKKDNCKLQGVLSCHLEASDMFGAVYQFRTSGFNSISYLITSMSVIKNATCGLLRGIPLSLVVRPKNVELDDGIKTDIYAVSLVYRGEREKLLKEVDQVLLLRDKLHYNESEYLRLAESIEVVPNDEEEQKDIADEFYSRRP
jgi:hypothetical protein